MCCSRLRAEEIIRLAGSAGAGGVRAASAVDEDVDRRGLVVRGRVVDVLEARAEREEARDGEVRVALRVVVHVAEDAAPVDRRGARGRDAREGPEVDDAVELEEPADGLNWLST